MSKKNNRGTRRAHYQKTCDKAAADAAHLEKKRQQRKQNGEKGLNSTVEASKAATAASVKKAEAASLDIFADLDKSLKNLPDAKQNFSTAAAEEETARADDVKMDGTARPAKPVVKKIFSLKDQKLRLTKRRQVQKDNEKKRVRKAFIQKQKMENMESDDDEEKSADAAESDSEAALKVRPTETRRDIKVRKRIERRERKGVKNVVRSAGKEAKKKKALSKKLLKKKAGVTSGGIKAVVKRSGKSKDGGAHLGKKVDVKK